MQESELLARLANAIVEYERIRARSESSTRKFQELTTKEEIYRLMCSVAGGECTVIERKLEELEHEVLECIAEGEVLENQAMQALRQISRIGMLSDGRTLREIDAHFQNEDAENKAVRREIRSRIAETFDKNR